MDAAVLETHEVDAKRRDRTCCCRRT